RPFELRAAKQALRPAEPRHIWRPLFTGNQLAGPGHLQNRLVVLERGCGWRWNRSWASGLESRCVLGGRGQLAHRLPEFVQLCDLRAVRLRDRERNPHIADLAQKVLLAPPEVGVAELGPIQKELSRLFGEVVHARFELPNELIWGEIH